MPAIMTAFLCVKVRTACASECAYGCAFTVSDCSADASARERSACNGSRAPVALFEMATSRASVHSIDGAATGSDGRAFLTANQCADGCASADDGDCTCLTTKS